MKNSFFSRFIVGLLILALSSQSMLMADPKVSDQRTAITQLRNTMKRYHKALKSYAKCIATGECESEHQKLIAADIRDLTKKLITLLAGIAIVGGAAWLVRRKIISDLGHLKKELDSQKEDIENRFDLQKRDIEKRVAKNAKAAKRDALKTWHNQRQALKNEVKGEVRKAYYSEKKDLMEDLKTGYTQVKADVEQGTSKFGLLKSFGEWYHGKPQPAGTNQQAAPVAKPKTSPVNKPKADDNIGLSDLFKDPAEIDNAARAADIERPADVPTDLNPAVADAAGNAVPKTAGAPNNGGSYFSPTGWYNWYYSPQPQQKPQEELNLDHEINLGYGTPQDD